MNIDAAASAAVEMKAVQLQGDVAMAVATQVLDTVKADAALMIQLLYASMGMGQNVNTLA